MVATLLHEFLGGTMQRHLPSICVGMGLFGFALIYFFPASKKFLNVIAGLMSAFLIWLGFVSKEE